MKIPLLLFATVALALAQTPVAFDGIPGVIAKGTTVSLVKEGFAFTEGPVAMPDGGLFFSDLLTSDRIYRIDPKGEMTVFREKANASGGLAVARTGEVFAVET